MTEFSLGNMGLGAFEFLPQAEINHQAHPEPQVGIAERIQANLLQGNPEAAVGDLFIIQEVQPHPMELPPGNFAQAPVNVHNQVLPQPAGFIQAPLTLHLPLGVVYATDEDLHTIQLEARRISSILIGHLLDLETIIRDVDLIRRSRNEN